MNEASSLVGDVLLFPGGIEPAIVNTRPQLAPRVASQCLAHELPDRLARVFALCATAHRLAAQLAIDAAQGRAHAAHGEQAQALRLATLREQVLRITHDWPRLLPASSHDVEPALRLGNCPLWRPDLYAEDQLQALPAWLAHHGLGMAPDAWLAAYDDERGEWVARWCAQAHGLLAHTLSRQCEPMRRLRASGAAIDLLADASPSMPRLAQRMRQEPDFCARPDWQGEVPDTGPWTRHHDSSPRGADDAWLRLVSRVADVLRLALQGGEQWLATGALTLAEGAGVAWVEMARGLLVHAVRLTDSAEGPRVSSCHTLAPTEWNFHPHGVLAEALTRLRGASMAEDAVRWAVAFDPCVEFRVEATGRTCSAAEPAHASALG